MEKTRTSKGIAIPPEFHCLLKRMARAPEEEQYDLGNSANVNYRLYADSIIKDTLGEAKRFTDWARTKEADAWVIVMKYSNTDTSTTDNYCLFSISDPVLTLIDLSLSCNG